MIAGGFRQQRRNAIAARATILNHTEAAFDGQTKGAALFAVPIVVPTVAPDAVPHTARAAGSFSKILCGYFQRGSASTGGVIISLSSPEIETISGPRAINVSLETVIVEPSAESVTGRYIRVSSARGGATLVAFTSDAFHGAMLDVDAELGYRLASNSNLRRVIGGAPEAVFSVNIVSRSTRFQEPSTTGLLAMVLLAPGIFAFKQGLAFGAWRAPEQLSECVAAAQPENIWGRLSGKMGILLGR